MAITLFDDENKCCGCGACLNVCPKAAISMKEDKYGFVYPEIDSELCVECGACIKACSFRNKPKKNTVNTVYAVAAKNTDLLRRSSSGGAFGVLATKCLKEHGVVYGAALVREEEKLTPKHIRIEEVNDLILLQGSKYVQSDIGKTYEQAQKDILKGSKVLFSGTPCQIAGLKQFLGKEHENLLTVEIICHGVPNKRIFQDYISCMENKHKQGKIVAYSFRDKRKGQDMTSLFVFEDKSERAISGKTTSYVSLFLKGLIYRKSCYDCPFSTADRVADITIGDYWGFHEEHPNMDKSMQLSNSSGISCVLINNKKGAAAFDKCLDDFSYIESSFEKVSKHNDQLRHPSRYNKDREVVLSCYLSNGYEGIEEYFRSQFWKEMIINQIIWLIPKRIKRIIKSIIKRVV